MEEILQEDRELESNEISKTNQTNNETASTKISISDLIATIKSVKIEEKELLNQRKELQETENDLRNQAIVEIDQKKKVISGLKSEIVFLQNKCGELEQALGIAVY
jgi:hypothetical protein